MMLLAKESMLDAPSHSSRSKSATWYVEFLNNLPVGIYRTTLEGNLIFYNRTFARIFDFDSRADFIGYPVVNLYRDKKNRGDLIQAVMKNGWVQDMCIPLKDSKGFPVWCSVTVKPAFDDDGVAVFLDGIVRDITEGIQQREAKNFLGDDVLSVLNGFMITFDTEGILMDINADGAEFLGVSREDIKGTPFDGFIREVDRHLFPQFLSEILEAGHGEDVFTIIGQGEGEQPIEIHAFVVRKEGRIDSIKGIVRFLTEKIRRQNEQLSKEKFRGVLEMAGGVSHRLNQPLTIINNLLNEVLSDLSSEDDNYGRIMKVHDQIKSLNEIAKKIRSIKKYEAMDYVSGIKIVDIDKAS